MHKEFPDYKILMSSNLRYNYLAMKTNNIPLILEQLHKEYEEPETELENWVNPIQFMVAVILSAQATDKGVNKVTPKLFEKYKTATDFANANIEELTSYVSSINYYITKAKRIVAACDFVLKNFGGNLPADISELIKIPGIGRKSANVIINEALKAETQGVVVDTHISRVSNRLGLTSYNDQKDAVKIEQELMQKLPKSEWQFYSNAGVLHGRYICVARKPKCEQCSLNKLCPSAFKIK